MTAAKSATRIAFLSLGSPRSIRSWSGIPFHTFRALSDRFSDIRVVETPRLDRLLSQKAKLARLGILLSHEPAVAKAAGRLIARQLVAIDPEVVVSINATHKVATLDGPWPLVSMDDGSFATIASYYQRYTGLSRRSWRLANALHQRMTDRSTYLFAASHWASESAGAAYDIPAGKRLVIPMGANVEDPGPPDPSAGREILRLLFVGYDWRRKGGEIALAAFQTIRQRVPKAELHIVGCEPEEARGEPGVTIHGRLRRSSPLERDRFNALFRESSFFFMPSRAEAYGLVYCEACAFGLPPVATRTGGVPTIVRDGQNGLLLDMDAPASAYAEAIISLWSSASAYEAMRREARLDYENRLNWDAWGDAAAKAIERAAQSGGQQPRSHDCVPP